jgi:hypothetical protein
MCGREAVGSPKFPSYPYEYMPCPHQTPVVPFLTCHVVRRSAAFRQVKSVGFPSLGWEDYPYGPRPTIFRGSISRPALSLHPAPNTPLLECTRVRYGPVGSTLVRSDLPCLGHMRRTDWVTSVSFRTSFFIPSLRIYLGAITSLVIGLVPQPNSIIPCIKGQRGFNYFDGESRENARYGLRVTGYGQGPPGKRTASLFATCFCL